MGKELTRRDFVRLAGAGGGLLALGGLAACGGDRGTRATASPTPAGQTWVFRSRPDLSPPPVEVTTPARGAAPGYVFAAAKNGPGESYPAQDGPMILDNEGRPVWLRPVRNEDEDAMDFKVQRYRGEPVLTWWQGVHSGYGQGEYLILDTSYREIARVRAGNGLDGDHHEFFISDRDTALFTVYQSVPMDLSPFGGPAGGAAIDGVAQEVNIETGEVIFEWHSLEHVGIDECLDAPAFDLKSAFDYFHINSIDVDDDDNLLVSARRTSAVYKIDRETGEVIWRLGGEKSDFAMGPGAQFALQHDARRRPDGTISVFDNRSLGTGEPSRGLVLEVDEEAMEATLAREFTHPDSPFAPYQGNVQVLPNGNAFVGWGSAPYLSEYGGDGELLFDAKFPPEAESYRAFRSEWQGFPEDRPAIAVESRSKGKATLYVSWNGATEVESWEILAGPDPDDLEPLRSVPRKGFETAIDFATDETYVAARARDRSGQPLGASEAVKRRG